MPGTVRVQLGAALSARELEVDEAAVRRLLARAVRATLRRQQQATAEISVTLLDDSEMADLNARFLGHEGATDVIAFTLYEEDEDPVGDVYIDLDEARRQAAAHAVTVDEELIRLGVHGVLHVLGFDHPAGPERLDSPMWQLQESIVADVLGA